MSSPLTVISSPKQTLLSLTVAGRRPCCGTHLQRIVLIRWVPSILSVRNAFKTFRIMSQKIISQFSVLFDGFKSPVVEKHSFRLVEKIYRDDQVSRVVKQNVCSNLASNVNLIPVHSIVLEAVEWRLVGKNHCRRFFDR